MYSCCNFEDETAPGGSQSTLPQYHVSTVPPPPPPYVISMALANPPITMAQQQQKQHYQQLPVYSALLPGSPPSGGHSGMALGPSNSPILGAPMPCSTFLPRHDRRLAVVDRWTRPKVGPEKSSGVNSGIKDLTQFQGMPPHWGTGVGVGEDEYKRYYGPIDPEGLGVSGELQNTGTQTPKTKHRVQKSSVNPRLASKGQASGHLPINPALQHPSSPQQSIWRRSSFSKRKGSGGPLYENILPLGRRGGVKHGMRDEAGRRGRLPPPLPLPIPVPLNSPTHTPPSPSPSICYTTSSSSSSSTSSSSSSSESVSRSNSPSSFLSCTSSQSFRYRANVYEDYDTDELTEESSLLLGRRKSRSRMSSRSLPSSPPPPPIPPRKPCPQRGQMRDRAGSQLAQLQEWWASWGEKEKRRAAGLKEGKEGKRHHKERERERKRRKKGRKKKKREERERERERKRRKVKKKKKKEEKTKRRERERRSEQEEGDIDRKEVFEKVVGQEYTSYPALRRSSFRKKSESSTRSYEWDITRDGAKRDRDDQGADDEDGSRGKERHHRSPKSHRHSRPRSNNKHYSTSNKPSSTVKFWASGNPSSESTFVPLLPLSKRRKSVGAERDERVRGGESRPLLGNDGRIKARSREGLSFHEWNSEEEDEESEVERSRQEEQGRRKESRGMDTESDRDREKTVEIYTDDEGSSGEFGKFERYWEGHEGRAVGGIGGGGWFFGTYPARERGGSINSRDDSLLPWGGGESSLGFGTGTGWGSGGLGSNQWPPAPLTPPPPRRYWSVDKLPLKTEKKSKSRSQEKTRGPTSCSCQSPHHSACSHSKWKRVTSRSQEELLPHCHSFTSSVRPKRQSSKPDRASGQTKSGSQSNLNAQRLQRSDRSRQPASPPQSLPPSLPSPMVPALPAPPSSSHHKHIPPPTSSSSVSSPSVVSSTPGAPQPSSLSSSSAKLQYQKLRSVPLPQRYQSPHLPLKTKSLCSRRGSAQFSSVESEV